MGYSKTDANHARSQPGFSWRFAPIGCSNSLGPPTLLSEGCVGGHNDVRIAPTLSKRKRLSVGCQTRHRPRCDDLVGGEARSAFSVCPTCRRVEPVGSPP